MTPSFTSLDDWLAWLETLSPREIDLGLERVAAVFERLRLPRAALVLNVAGTNGKGSTAAMLEALLIDGGRRVGCYTSPHLLRYNERIRIDGIPAEDAAIVSAFGAVEAERQGLALTYFEFGTLAALVVFARAGADALVLEIGMGGRLDAVNAVEPDGGIITNVARDHCEWLGQDVETIAAEKAGIMRRDKAVIFGSDVVPAAIPSTAARVGADLRILGRDFALSQEASERWTWRGRSRVLEGLRLPSLAGRFQLRNAAAALALLEAIGEDPLLTNERVSRVLAGLSVPGRFQWLGEAKRWLFDVAHNPHASASLADSLANLQPRRTVTAVIGVLADKDLPGIVEPLVPQVARWIAVTAKHARALDARTLAQTVAHLANKPCLIVDALPEALQYADQCTPAGEVILVTGSFYTVGPALTNLRLPSHT